MGKQLLFLLLLFFCADTDIEEQNRSPEREIVEFSMPAVAIKNRLFLLHTKNRQTTGIGEHYVDFLQKFGVPTKQEEYENPCMGDAPMIELCYKKNSFHFYKKDIYDTILEPNNNIVIKKSIEKGLDNYELCDKMFVLYDKERNISIGVGDDQKALQRFVPNYKSNIHKIGVRIKFRSPGYPHDYEYWIYILVGKDGKVNNIVYSVNDC